MKQYSIALKFGTQNMVTTCTLTLRKKYGVLLKVHLRHTLCHFNNLGSQESNTSNGVQIKAKMNKL